MVNFEHIENNVEVIYPVILNFKQIKFLVERFSFLKMFFIKFHIKNGNIGQKWVKILENNDYTKMMFHSGKCVKSNWSFGHDILTLR